MESTNNAATTAVVGHVSQPCASPSGAGLAVGCGGSPSQGPAAPPHSSAEPSYTTLSVTHEKSIALHEDGDELETGSMVGEEMDMFDIELQREFQAGLGLARQEAAQTPPSHFYHFYTEPSVGNGSRAPGLTLGGTTATYGGAASSWPWAQDATAATSATHSALHLPAVHSLPSAGSMSRGTGPTLVASTGLSMVRTMTGSSSSPASLTPPPTAPALVASDGVAEAFAVKRFPSVAGACQVSSVLQDRDECMRVVHHLAEELRRELHLNTQNVSTSAGSTQMEQPSPMPAAMTGAASPSQTPPPSVTAGFDEDMKLLTMFLQDMQQSYHSAWRTPYSPGTAALPSHAAATSYSNNNNSSSMANNGVGGPVMAVSRANGVISARTHTSSTSPTLQNATAPVIGGHPAAAAGHPGRLHGSAPVTTTTSYVGGSLPFHRTSPAGSRGAAPGLNGVNANSTSTGVPSWATMTSLPTGRNTIDAEVNDSLRRIELAHTGANGVPSLTMPLHEYEQRPINPYQGGPHGGLTTPRQVPQTQYPSHYVHYSHGGSATHANTGGANNNNNMAVLQQSTSGNAHGVSRAEAGGVPVVGLNMSAVIRKANRSSSGAHSVAHPRAVKPGVSKGRSRGPRSQTGKNVSPSNHSAFSECSGGETRSYQSTVTACHQNASSTNATTNTSLSSAVFRAHSGGQVGEGSNTTIPTTTSSNGNISGGAGGAGPVSVTAGAVVAGTVTANAEP